MHHFLVCTIFPLYYPQILRKQVMELSRSWKVTERTMSYVALSKALYPRISQGIDPTITSLCTLRGPFNGMYTDLKSYYQYIHHKHYDINIGNALHFK